MRKTPSHPIVSAALKFIILASMLVGLPLIGVAAMGLEVRQFLEFPPLTRYVAHAQFSWPVFCAVGVADLILFGSLGWILFYDIGKGNKKVKKSDSAAFPWWGVLGLCVCICGWVMAWTRFEWFSMFQRHTFIPLWLGYILFINSLCYRRSETCPLTEHPVRFLLLFPVSSIFWWFFEYLNRFVQNWHYVGISDFDPLSYVIFSSLSFSTVLPAVFCTYRFLPTFFPLGNGAHGDRRPGPEAKRWIPLAILLLSGTGLALIGLYPDYLFPLLWVSPLLIIAALQSLFNHTRIFSEIVSGDRRTTSLGPLAALICGFLWEMWNIHSMAKWEYAIPYVNRFQIFEMPVLGYGGYLPFGLECLLICKIVWRSDLMSLT